MGGGGETKESVSAWTVDSLHQMFMQVVNERDLRYEQRFQASQQALTAALTAQEKAVSAALLAAERAVLKAEQAAEKRFDSVNEFRGQLADQAARLLPRAESDVAFAALREKIEALTGRLESLGIRIERGEGKSSGLKEGWGVLIGAAGFISTLIAIAYALTK